jgi:hypothetical protein
MRQTTGTRKSPGEKIVKDIKRATRKQYSSEEKIRIVFDGLRGEDSIAGCCQTNAHQSHFCSNLNLLGCAEAAPLGKSGGAVQLEIRSVVEMTLLVEMVVD